MRGRAALPARQPGGGQGALLGAGQAQGPALEERAQVRGQVAHGVGAAREDARALRGPPVRGREIIARASA